MQSVEHNFTVKTYKSPTYCDVCKKLLWGISRQGSACLHCEMNVHKKCLLKTTEISCKTRKGKMRRHSMDFSIVDPNSMTPDASPSKEDELNDIIESTVKTNQVDLERRGSEFYYHSKDRFSTPAFGKRAKLPANVLSPEVTKEKKDQENADSSILKNLFHETAKTSYKMKKEGVGSPPLNVFTTLPKNYVGFLTKVGPLASFQDKVEDIIFWENPTETVLALTIYILICLHPQILVFLPHFLICWVIFNNYYYKEKISVKKHKKQVHSESSIKDPYALKPDRIDYTHNMTFIQNSMGMYCDTYASLRMLNLKLNWSNERQTLLILQLTIASAVLIYLFWNWIPFQLLAILGGCLFFISNTAFGKASQQLAVDYFQKQLNNLDLEAFKKWLNQGTKKKIDQDTKLE